MITCKEYTKEEIAAELKISASRSDIIIHKLKKEGYLYKVSGKGATYRITITALPGLTLKQFAKEYFKLDIRFEDRFAHYLKSILQDNTFLNISYLSQEYHTNTGYHILSDWTEALKNCGLVEENAFQSFFYATKKEFQDSDDDLYLYSQNFKCSDEEEFNTANKAFNDCYNEFLRNKDHYEVVLEEGQYYANKMRKAALEGWWAVRRDAFREINKDWPHLFLLSSLLEHYDTSAFIRWRTGSHSRDEERIDLKKAEWASIKVQQYLVWVEERRDLTYRPQWEIDNRNLIEHAQRVKEIVVELEEPLPDCADPLQKIDIDVLAEMPVFQFADFRKGLIYMHDKFGVWHGFLKWNADIVDQPVSEYSLLHKLRWKKFLQKTDKRNVLLAYNGRLKISEKEFKNFITKMRYIDFSTEIDNSFLKMPLIQRTFLTDWLLDISIDKNGILHVTDLATTDNWQREVENKYASFFKD